MASVTVLEFADYECPYCQQIQPVLFTKTEIFYQWIISITRLNNIIQINNYRYAGKGAVVHIWPCIHYIPQGWCFEFAPVFFPVSYII